MRSDEREALLELAAKLREDGADENLVAELKALAIPGKAGRRALPLFERVDRNLDRALCSAFVNKHRQLFGSVNQYDDDDIAGEALGLSETTISRARRDVSRNLTIRVPADRPIVATDAEWAAWKELEDLLKRIGVTVIGHDTIIRH